MSSAPDSFARSRPLALLAVLVVALTAAHLLDWWAHEALLNPRFGERDFGRMLRVLGFLPLWMIAGLALALCDFDAPRRYARGLLLFFGAGLSGLAAEVLKIGIRRERPNAEIGEYVFRAWAEQPFHTGGLGLPSSHALVAFGGVFMLARLFPRARWVWYALGAGCAYSRVAAGAHFLSDVVMSAAVGWVIVALLWRRYGAAAEMAPPAERALELGGSPVRPLRIHGAGRAVRS